MSRLCFPVTLPGLHAARQSEFPESIACRVNKRSPYRAWQRSVVSRGNNEFIVSRCCGVGKTIRKVLRNGGLEVVAKPYCSRSRKTSGCGKPSFFEVLRLQLQSKRIVDHHEYRRYSWPNITGSSSLVLRSTATTTVRCCKPSGVVATVG